MAADLHKRFKVEVSPDEVMIMPGGKPTMFMSILMFGEPGVEIMYPGSRLSDLSLDDRVHRREAGAGADPRGERLRVLGRRDAEADHADKTRLIIINSPANPTGGVTPKAEVDKLVAGLEKWPERRRDVGRDLRPHGLRRRDARVPAHPIRRSATG